MIKKRTYFPDPDPDTNTSIRTSPPTESEAHIVEKYDPLSPDPAENVVGVIVRAAVDCARYNRSLSIDPEHYTRLINSAQYFASMRLANRCQEVQGLARAASRALEAIDWTETQVPRPTINETLPYSGDESSVALHFIYPVAIERQELPA